MPSIAWTSAVREFSEQFTLTLKARHNLVVGSASDVVYATKTRFPGCVDVQLTDGLVLTLSGFFDGIKISTQDLQSSAVVNHLSRYLDTKASEWGFQNVSKVYVDERDGLPKLTLASPSCLRRELQSPRVSLVSIDLYYVWRTVPGLSQHKQSKIDIALFQDRPHPFAPQLLLPVEYVLDSALEKFVSLHLVRCYPLIFGSLGRKLDVEATFFPVITRSVLSVIAHSADPMFRKNCQSMISVIANQHSSVLRDTSSAISNYFNNTQATVAVAPVSVLALTGEETLSLSMERLYKSQGPSILKNFTGRKWANYEEHLHLSCENYVDLSPQPETLQCSRKGPSTFNTTSPGQSRRGPTTVADNGDEEFWLEDFCDDWKRDSSTLIDDSDHKSIVVGNTMDQTTDTSQPLWVSSQTLCSKTCSGEISTSFLPSPNTDFRTIGRGDTEMVELSGLESNAYDSDQHRFRHGSPAFDDDVDMELEDFDLTFGIICEPILRHHRDAGNWSPSGVQEDFTGFGELQYLEMNGQDDFLEFDDDELVLC